MKKNSKSFDIFKRLGYESVENQKVKTLLAGQLLVSIPWLIICFLFMLIIEWLSPNFFNYPYFYLNIQSILYFTPLFAYAAVMAGLSTLSIVSTVKDEENFALGIGTSVLAGTWEELGFRWIFICTSMAGIVVMNWLLGTFFIWFLVVFFFGISLFLLLGGDGFKKLISIIPFGFGMLFFHLAGKTDPLLWLYDVFFLPVTNFFTIGFFENILYGDYPKLFIFGMIAANAKFRDGHKYQGPIGIVNSWFVGFILMYCMLTYGLFTAIILHIIYDLEFDIIRYVGRKLYGTKGYEVTIENA